MCVQQPDDKLDQVDSQQMPNLSISDETVEFLHTIFGLCGGYHYSPRISEALARTDHWDQSIP